MMDRPHRSQSKDPEAVALFNKAYQIYMDDPEAAKEMLRRAIDLGCVSSMVLLGDIIIDGGDDDRTEALELFRKAHECGDNMGSRNLGYCYAIGLGTPVDKEKAAEWYIKSAELGNAKAMCNIGVLYEYGHGVDQDYEKAAEWFRRSAEGGNSRGRTNYACLLRDGKGVKKDPEKAVYWFKQSGSPRAKRLLAQMYLSGTDIERSVPQARLLLESASATDRKAMFLLGDLIYNEDKDRAVMLFKRAAEKGLDDAIQRLTELGIKIPPKKTRF